MPKTKTTPPTAADVRAWARAQGHAVGQRGYISEAVVTAFNKGKRGNARYVPAAQRETVAA